MDTDTELNLLQIEKEEVLSNLSDFILEFYGEERIDKDDDCKVCNLWNIYDELEDAL